jgi:hypothetical protein
MTLIDFQRVLRAFCHRQPFQPFLIELVSGTQFVVSHPEVINFRGALIVFNRPDLGSQVFDSASVCQLLDRPLRPQAQGSD